MSITTSTEQKKSYSKHSVIGLRTVYWGDDDKLHLINQPLLPEKYEFATCGTVKEVYTSINSMVVRGAPAIGVTGAYGMVIASRQDKYQGQTLSTKEYMIKLLTETKAYLDSARPTAVNLSWATTKMLEFAQNYLLGITAGTKFDKAGFRDSLLNKAHSIAEDDAELNKRLAKFGAEVVLPGSNILHHCNTGALATVDYGTALGVIYESHAQGKNIHVWVDETRPRLQGARLTAWELTQAKIPMTLICDSVSGPLMRRGDIDIVVFGADRVAANGDTANKIGSYNLSVVARENGVPVYACVPLSTVDFSIATGDDIEIEYRGDDEVAHFGGSRMAPVGVKVLNPAFDVTPAKYLTGIITEEGICYPPFVKSLKEAKLRADEKTAGNNDSIHQY